MVKRTNQVTRWLVVGLISWWKGRGRSEGLEPTAFQAEVLWHVDYFQSFHSSGGELPWALFDRATKGVIVDREAVMQHLHPALDRAGNGAAGIAKVITPLLLDLCAQGVRRLPRNPALFAIAALVLAERRS